MKKILFTTSMLEHPPAGGPFLRIENSIKALNEVGQLHIISRVFKKNMGGKRAEGFYKKHSFSFLYAPSVSDNYRSSLKCRLLCRLIKVLSLFGIKPDDFLKKYFIKLDAKFILAYAEKEGIDTVWVGYGCISYDLIKEIRKRNASIKIICDTDSVTSRFILRELPYTKKIDRYKKIEQEGKLQRKRELELVNLCNVTTAVSQVDAEYYKMLALHPERVKIFSNVIDASSYLKNDLNNIELKLPFICLPGTFAPNSPMEHAARWVLKEVWPLLKKEDANVYFYIVGNGADHTLKDVVDDRVVIIGKTDSLQPFLSQASAIVTSLMFESGTRFKILEAGACATPVVSTTLGAEGLGVVDGHSIMIADEADKFAGAILKLLKDKEFADEIANNCKELIYEKYSLSALANESRQILNFLEKRGSNNEKICEKNI